MMAMALGSAWAGGFWFCAVLARRGGARPLGMAAAGRRRRAWARILRRRRVRCRRLALALHARRATEPGGLRRCVGSCRRRGRGRRRRRSVEAHLGGRGRDLRRRARRRRRSLARQPAYGLAAMLWLFAVVWGTDVMAYFGGRLIGGPKLWPSVSPGKTWSGARSGAIASAILGTLCRAVVARRRDARIMCP